MSARWKEIPFEQFATLQRGADLPNQSRRSGPYPVLASNGPVGYHDTAFTSGPGVVTGRSGTIGKPTFIDGPYWPLNTVLWVSNFHGNNPRFVFYFFRFFDFLNYATGTSVPTLNRNFVHSVLVRVPPLCEQEKIATLLFKVQHAMEIEEKLIATARELKRSAMQSLFSKGIRKHGLRETDYGPLPTKWPTQLLGECCYVQTGVTKGRKIPANEAVEVPYIRVANVQDGHLDLREIKTITIRRGELSGYLLQDGDVLLTEGGDFDKLGRGFIWRGQITNCIHQNHVFAVRTNRDVLLPEFFAYLVQSPYGKFYFLTVAHKTTNLASINSTKLKGLPVPLPPLEEQREIITALQIIDRKIEVHERKCAVLCELFKTLLHNLMVGDIRVADFDIDTSKVAVH
jgi:type I restriction enzyme S subunit